MKRTFKWDIHMIYKLLRVLFTSPPPLIPDAPRYGELWIKRTRPYKYMSTHAAQKLGTSLPPDLRVEWHEDVKMTRSILEDESLVLCESLIIFNFPKSVKLSEILLKFTIGLWQEWVNLKYLPIYIQKISYWEQACLC